MDAKMPKNLQKWAITRQKGKRRYVLQTGVLAWGVPMFVIMTFIVNRRPDEPLTMGLIAISAVIWAMGGTGFGLATWAWAERRCLKYLTPDTHP